MCLFLPELFNVRTWEPIMWIYMWTPLRTQYGVLFLYFPWIFFLMDLMGIHMILHVAMIPQWSLGFNLLPHGMCPTREQRGLCTVARAKYKKSEGRADYPADSTNELQTSCLTLFLYQSTTSQDKPLAKLNTLRYFGLELGNSSVTVCGAQLSIFSILVSFWISRGNPILLSWMG